jgi:hypothetical protein
VSGVLLAMLTCGIHLEYTSSLLAGLETPNSPIQVDETTAYWLGMHQSAKYEFASSNTTRTTFAFEASFVWKLAPLADERNRYFI